MGQKKRILKIAVVLFMVITIALSTSKTYAYWSNAITMNQTTQSTNTINIGDWTQAFPWNSYTRYQSEDLVIYNQHIYEARSSNTNVEPETGFWSFWWLVWKRIY